MSATLARGWPDGAEPGYVARTRAASAAAAARGTGVLAEAPGRPCSGVWCGWGVRRTSCSAGPPAAPLRLRVATPWDWRLRFRLEPRPRAPARGPAPGGMAGRGTEKDTGVSRAVVGHVEVRWNHGRFSGPPEAKVYLDVAHHEVPGYLPLDAESVAQEPDGRGPGCW